MLNSVVIGFNYIVHYTTTLLNVKNISILIISCRVMLNVTNNGRLLWKSDNK